MCLCVDLLRLLWLCLISFFFPVHFSLLSPHSIHKAFCFRQRITSRISDLTERLLLEDRDPPATPQESLYEVPPFDEVIPRIFITCGGILAVIIKPQ